MPWRVDPQTIVPEAARDLEALLGDALRSLVLYGSAAGSGFDPTRSDVNLAAVLEPLGFTQLQRAAQWWARWRGQRIAAPLLLSSTDLERSLDVFPLEFLDIQAWHRTLAGSELFRDLSVAPAAVRAECEREAKGKLLRLRELYLELAGSTRDVGILMRDSRKTFLPVLRGLLYLRGEPWGGDDAAVVAAFERRFGRRLAVLGALNDDIDDAVLAPHFAEYLVEIETLAEIADREAQPARGATRR